MLLLIQTLVRFEAYLCMPLQDFAAASLIKSCVPPLSNKENLQILSVRAKEWLQ